jgi:predicted MFS family arabinose efflux permease
MRQSARKHYLLILLTVILAFNYVDRVVLGVVLEPIKVDLSLSDTQLGVLSGIAFALFYSVMGIPIARWADRGNRVSIIALTAVIWSVAVALCGAARSYVQLLLIRVLVGVGEAGCIPPAHSLIADVFTREERPRAVALYAQGGTLAMTGGYFAAGWLSETFGWRTTFVVVGLPGLLIALIAWLTLRDPRRARSPMDRPPAAVPSLECSPELQPTLREASRILWRNAAFRHLLICFSVTYFFGYGILQWQPTFFIRSHGLTTGEVGAWFAVVYGVIGGLGTYVGGECAATSVLCSALTAASFLVHSTIVAMTLLGLANLFGYVSMGPMLATIQTLVAPRMRAVSIAVLYFCANLIGLGLGPVVAGILSDVLAPGLGAESLRYALVLLCPGYAWAAWHLWRAGRTVTRDILNVQVEKQGPVSLQGAPSDSLPELRGAR